MNVSSFISNSSSLSNPEDRLHLVSSSPSPFIMSAALLIFMLSLVIIVPKFVLCDPQVPCYFIFGDSLADPGNNNDLQTMAKANYPPYGIDLPQGPSGRFTNGQTYVDIIAALLGFDHDIAPYVSAKDHEILTGLNYASGAAGIRDETGTTQGERFPMNKQLAFHEATVSKLGSMLKSDVAAAEYLKKCMYTVGLGSNDYINNYFMPESYSSSKEYTPDAYASLLIEEYATQLKKLYNSGARKVALVGLAQLGLTPVELARQGPVGVVILNAAVDLFNSRLRTLVDDLNNNFNDANFIYLNTAGIITASNAITITKLRSCCQVRSRTNFTCIPFYEDVCAHRDKYSFFDNIHPTEALNKVIAPRYYSASLPTDAYPFDIRHLAHL